jgi:hypothetical protein
MPVEVIGLYVLAAAAILVVIASLWLLVKAFKQSVWWGLGVLFFPPLALLFVVFHFKPSRGPLAVFLLAGLLVAGALVAGQLSVTRDPRIKIVDGEKHITLTRAEVDDYAILAKHPDVVVLQMANDDVTDDTLKHLEGMSQLRELDLNDTKVTDAGLALIAQLPKLEELRLARTMITDDGFRRYLLNKPELMKLDLTGCKKVRGKTKREWQAQNQERKLVD